MPFDANLLAIDGFVSFKIIQRAACSPRPGFQSSPIIKLARLASVHKANNSLRKPFSVVGLNAGGDEFGISPAFCQNLLLPCRPALRLLRKAFGKFRANCG